MRSILIILSIVFLSNINAQVNFEIYDPSKILGYSSNSDSFEIIDSLCSNCFCFKVDNILGPYDFLNKSQKLYSKHIEFNLNQNQKSSLDIFNDTTILYNHFYYSNSTNSYLLVASGELKIDLSHFSIKKTLGFDQVGEDSIVYDTLYKINKTGIWSIKNNIKICQTGIYSKDKKDGIWYNYLSEYENKSILPVINEFEYKCGILLKNTQIDLPKDINNLEQNLEGCWYNIGLRDEDIRRCLYGKCSLIFVKDSSQLNYSFCGVYDILKFNKKNEVETKSSVKCGVGVNPDDLNKTQMYYILDSETMIINDQKFNIEYLSNEVLILSYQ